MVLYYAKPRCLDITPLAANTIWPAGCIREHHLVEASGPMTVLSEFLLSERGQGIPPNTYLFPGVRHRRFMPSTDVTGDLVMSGYALLEMAGEHDRRRVIESLWSRTNAFLVLIEEGTRAGHTALLEARDWLSQLRAQGGIKLAGGMVRKVFIKERFTSIMSMKGTNHLRAQSSKAIKSRAHKIRNGGDDMHIFAPCPHSFACGRAGLGCKSTVKYYQFGLTRDPAYSTEEAFSYLVVSRGDWRRFTKEGLEGKEVSTHPRIVSPRPAGGGPALDIDLCLPNGDCERVVFSKSGTNQPLYFFLKNSLAGDIAPCERVEDANANAENSTKTS
ncbi:hypothetical protein ACTXT7_004640 [Hymenolepis weldensis]